MAVVIFSTQQWTSLTALGQDDIYRYIDDAMSTWRFLYPSFVWGWWEHSGAICAQCAVPLVLDEIAARPRDDKAPGSWVCFECLEDVHLHAYPKDTRSVLLDPFRVSPTVEEA